MARRAIHPGEHLAEELKALGMSAAALSRDINVPVNRITGIINGTRTITADTAIRLGHWFSSSAILRERSTRPDEDAPPHVQPQIIPDSTKKTHETDYRASTKPRQSGVHKRAERATRKAR